MKFARQLFDFYLQSSLHVALAVMSLVYVTTISANLLNHFVYPACVFFGTVLGYNFLKYYIIFYKREFHSTKYYGILFVSLLAAIGMIPLFFMMNETIQISIVFSGFFVAIYPLLRRFGWLKLFVVSSVVTFITVYIPYIFYKPIVWDYYLTLIQRFLILISLLIPFEIIDSETDCKTMNTLPQRFGIQKVKLFGILLVVPFIVLEFLKENSSLIVIPVGVITVLAIHFTSLKRNEYYTLFWVESIPIVWMILLFAEK
ncbi:hypothetical protein [Flavobacterium sp.]|uniref:hypothetical protein n=1 Tax=Flavobacterium sp. TaxID=239 RepID=UPI002B4ADE0A|nr:hypothetical protein [Flavobacterium sp.]HLP64981.1 hypothetical protein [Flavobacterium sp.]